MTQTTATPRSLSSIGEAISHELGAKMVKDFQDNNPGDEVGNFIGREIIEQILNQPGCVGINFYNAINETGRKTLVYVGVDETGALITRYTGIDEKGKLKSYQGIVADRSFPPMSADDVREGWWEQKPH